MVLTQETIEYTESEKIEEEEPVVNTTSVGPTTICNWELALETAIYCAKEFGHAIITSNGRKDRQATKWYVRREIR